ncbi:amidohydrolase, partial [bacterium]|nr:amidohydrolase [bacterium]
MIFFNGNFYTQNPELTNCSAIGTVGNRIVSLGDLQKVRNEIGFPTQEINLKGKTVIPGIIDSHTHFTEFCLSSQRINLKGITSIDEALQKIQSKLQTHNKNFWLTGGGWNPNIVGMPNKNQLDNLSKNVPIALETNDYHTLWCNSKALELGKITKELALKNPAEIPLDENGELLGILYEKARKPLIDLFYKPKSYDYTKIFPEGFKTAHSFGITGIHACEGEQELEIYQELLAKNELFLRIFKISQFAEIEKSPKFLSGNDFLKSGHVKFFYDGALSSQTAKMLEPYENTKNCGIGNYTPEEAEKMVNKILDFGFEPCVHAIGDKANHEITEIYEKITAQRKIKNSRFRIEHAQHLNENLVKRLAKLGTVLSMQPVHILEDAKTCQKLLGKRSRNAFPFGSLLKNGAKVSFGSDVPIETI